MSGKDLEWQKEINNKALVNGAVQPFKGARKTTKKVGRKIHDAIIIISTTAVVGGIGALMINTIRLAYKEGIGGAGLGIVETVGACLVAPFVLDIIIGGKDSSASSSRSSKPSSSNSDELVFVDENFNVTGSMNKKTGDVTDERFNVKGTMVNTPK